jgi:hypothetical protein
MRCCRERNEIVNVGTERAVRAGGAPADAKYVYALNVALAAGLQRLRAAAQQRFLAWPRTRMMTTPAMHVASTTACDIKQLVTPLCINNKFLSVHMHGSRRAITVGSLSKPLLREQQRQLHMWSKYDGREGG